MTEAERGRSLERFVLSFGKVTRDEKDWSEGMMAAAQAILEVFSAGAVAFLLYNPSLRSVYVMASLSTKGAEPWLPSDITLRITTGSALSRCIDGFEEPQIVPPIDGDPILGSSVGRPAIVSPMLWKGKLIGFIVLNSDEPQELLEKDGRLLMAVTDLIALKVVSWELTQRLRDAEERYRMLTESAVSLAFVLDRGGRFTYVNQKCKDILSYEPDELVGRYFGEFVTPESWAKTVAAVKKAAAAQEKYVEYEWVVNKKDGGRVTLQIEASLTYQGFEIDRHQGIARDASAEIILKEELQKKGKELSAVRSREERMREYLTVANMAQEEERARIARDIHDGAVQYLVAIRRRLDLFERERSRPNESRRGLSEEDLLRDIDSLLDAAITDLRQFARNLRPPVLDDFGLASACEWLAGETEKEGIAVQFAIIGQVRRLPQDVEVSVFRIAQEALSNAVKHSGGTEVEFSLDFRKDKLLVLLSDNGKGFEFRNPQGSFGKGGQMGLVGMFERAELIGATLDFRSSPGHGTSLKVEVPLQPPRQ